MISKFGITLMVCLGLLATPPLLAIALGPSALLQNTSSLEGFMGSTTESLFDDSDYMRYDNFDNTYYELPIGSEIDESEFQELKDSMFESNNDLPSGEEDSQCQEASISTGAEILPSEIPEEKSNTTYHEPPQGYEIDESELQELKNRPFKPTDDIPVNEEDKEPDPLDETGQNTKEVGSN
jgi:hypothetical protein